MWFHALYNNRAGQNVTSLEAGTLASIPKQVHSEVGQQGKDTMRVFIAGVCLFVAVSSAGAQEAPKLPETAVLVTKTTAKREWAGDILIESHLYSDTTGNQTHFFEVYYLKKHSWPIRITWREAYGDEVTIWVAPSFRDE